MEILVLVLALLTGLVAGFVAPSSCVIAFVLLMFFLFLAVIVEERGTPSSRIALTLQDIGGYCFFVLIGTIVGVGAQWVWRHPVTLLYAFWLYTFVATGYLISRCCVGWHIGAAAAVLTSFIAVGLFVQSFYGAGPEWVAALIVAFGLWWGADSWRRANGLALNE